MWRGHSWDGKSDISEAVAMLVYKHHRSTYFTLMFNPVTGDVISDDPCDLDLDQALLLPETHSDLPRPVLLVGVDNSAMILPTAAVAHLVKEMPRLFVMTSPRTRRRSSPCGTWSRPETRSSPSDPGRRGGAQC